MEERRTKQLGLYILLAVVVLYVRSRLIDTDLITNDWSFVQWQFIPTFDNPF